MKKVSADVINEISTLNELGFSSKEIAIKLNRGSSGVLRLMENYGIKSKYFELKYEEKLCLGCGEIFKSLKSLSQKFCNKKCSINYLNTTKIMTEEIKYKISKKLKHPDKFITCKCGKDFKYNSIYPKKKNCSLKCSYKFKDKTIKDSTREKLSKAAKNRHSRNDKTFGWQTRNNLEPSYPESIAIRFFKENNINFEREVKVDRYFADFIILNNIVIEIDGKQHEKPERKLSDILKDEILNNNDFIVYRIKYPKENIRKRLQEIINSVLAQGLEQFSDEE